MLHMLLFTLKVDQDVVNKDHNKLVQLRHEYRVLQVHECAGALVSPNDITKYSYNTYLVEKTVLGTSSGWILI
jgi:hypothetical protein